MFLNVFSFSLFIHRFLSQAIVTGGVSHGAIVGTGNGEKPKQKIKCAQGMSSPKYAGVNVKQTKSILKCLGKLIPTLSP